MLDKIINKKGSDNYIPYEKNVTIHEHRAPTDESIKIYNEMREKAKGDIIATIPLQSTFIDAVIIAFQEKGLAQCTEIRVCFNINGELIQLQQRDITKKRIMENYLKNRNDFNGATLLMKEAISMISEYIATRMMETHLKNVFNVQGTKPF